MEHLNLSSLPSPFANLQDPQIDLSVVVVTHRTRDHVLNCLRTLFREGGLDDAAAEVIVVDNASGDGTAQAVREQYPEAILIASDDNLGFSQGNNMGIARSRGRNVLLLNPDTLVPPVALARCVAYLEEQPESVGAMTCRVQSVDGSIQHECARRLITPWSECCRALLLDKIFRRVDWFNRERIVGWDKRSTRPVPCILGAFMLIRRPVLERLGALDERFFLMYEDVDWCKRAADADITIHFWADGYITHLGGGFWRQEPIITYANTHVSAMIYFRKHHPRAVRTVRIVSKVGMEMKIALLRLRGLVKPGDAWVAKHLPMAIAARETLQTGEPLRYGNWQRAEVAEKAAEPPTLANS